MSVRKFGWKPNLPDHREKKYTAHPEMAVRQTFPPLISLQSLMSPIEDQGSLGSCVAHASTGAIEFLELKELKENSGGAEVFPDKTFDPISRLFNYFNARALDGHADQDSGTTISSVIRAMKTWGICRESIWPYLPKMVNKAPDSNAYKEGAQHIVLGDYRLDNTVMDQLKQCLVTGYPIIFGMSVFDSFMSEESARTGLIPMPSRKETMVGGHALCMVGYDDSNHAFIIRNSWGINWGMHGYCYIPYDYLTNKDLATDFWTLRKE